MTLKLSPRDREMLKGGAGPAAQLAMSIIVRMAEIYDAEHLLDIEAAHIDSSLYMGEATLAYAERLADMGAQVVVPTSLNVSGVDQHHWSDWPVPPDWAEKATRQMVAYQSMGCTPTWTCAPYQTEFRPKFGQQIAWGESNAIAFANSVIGARTERYPDLLDICAALTGRVPAIGLHLDQNRAGGMLLRLENVPPELQRDDRFYPVLGTLMGALAGEQVPVVEGFEIEPREDQLKALCAAVASSGTVGLFHLVGITPEAPTFDDAFQGREPKIVHPIDMQALLGAYRQLTTHDGQQLDMVVLGSPHFSLDEFKRLAHLLQGHERHPDVRFLVTSSRAMAALAEKAGFVEPLRQFGGSITVDTCILTTPMLPPEIKILMTNSAKYAYYAPGLLNTQVVFGSLEDCVRSAVQGHVLRDHSLWEGS
jgi:predicted aconitase